MTEPRDIAQDLRERALALGFSDVRFTDASLPARHGINLENFVAAGMHGSMEWMAETLERRKSPDALWPEARSAIVLGLNYAPVLKHSSDPRYGRISVYARNGDYHDLIKKRLKHLGRWLVEQTGAPIKVFVDTAPLMEVPLAAQAGLGWAGRHTNLVSRRFGSWLFLGVILTSLPLPVDPPGDNHCGTCRRCRNACPTDALSTGPDGKEGRIDARRCISYLTIEHKGHIPIDLREPIGARIYGCDDCVAVCPWNVFAPRTREEAFWPRAELAFPRLADLLDLDEAAFRQIFAGSPVKRIGRDRFIRNVLIAAANSGDATLLSRVQPLLVDPSEIVRAMAVWACRRLMTLDAFEALRGLHAPAETAPAVRQEWHFSGDN